MTHVRIGFFHGERAELVRVEESLIVEGFPGLRTDVGRMAGAHCLLEITNEMTREGLSMPQVFSLLLSFLRILDSGEDAAAMTRFFEIKLLTILGYLPHLDGCVSCREGLNGEGPRTVFFSAAKGGVLCPECREGMAGEDLIPLSVGTARLLSAAVRFEPEKLLRLKPDASFASEGSAVLDGFIRHQIGKELKTRVFLDKLKRTAL